MARKYFKSKAEAKQALCDRKRNNVSCCDEIFKMPKGTRHAGQYAVCSTITNNHLLLQSTQFARKTSFCCSFCFQLLDPFFEFGNTFIFFFYQLLK